MLYISIYFIGCNTLVDTLHWQSTDNKNVLLKDKLTQSLTHLKDILVNIEGKIEHERKTLSQINNDFNRKQHPAIGRIDYDHFSDIWWKPESPVADETTEMNKTETPFIKDLKTTMKKDDLNYLTAFVKKAMELVATKNIIETMPVIIIFITETQRELEKGTFKNMDEYFVASLNETLPLLTTMLPSIKDFSWLYLVLNDTLIISTPQYQLINFYGRRFNKAGGEKLFKALEAFNDYPYGNKTSEEVSAMIMQALLNPHVLQGNTVNKTTDAVITNKAPAQRRSMNYEKKIKHFLLKHLNFDKIKQLYKNFKKNKHQYLSQKQKLDQNYRRSHDGHYLNKRDQTRQRAQISSKEDYNHFEYFQHSVEKDILHKIKEVSSYSDEEEHLRNNLYDALRHGNTTFVSFRKSDGGVNNKQILRALSSETDDEWVLKNNIYKVFEQKKNSFIN